jgi:rhodanese-related sulfurtransferase
MKKSVPAIVLLILFSIASVAIAADRAQLISPEKAKAMVEKNRGSGNFVILDVRTPEEYGKGHLKGAMLINFYDKDFKAQVSRLDKNKTYLVYCRSGSRSASATDIMKGLGFKRVYTMNGGITLWQRKGYPVVK